MLRKRRFCRECKAPLPNKAGRTEHCESCRFPDEEKIKKLKREIRAGREEESGEFDDGGCWDKFYEFCPTCEHRVRLDEQGDCLFCKMRDRGKIGFAPSRPVPLEERIGEMLIEGPEDVRELARRLGVGRDTVRQVLESVAEFVEQRRGVWGLVERV
jgi:hypothetical protein